MDIDPLTTIEVCSTLEQRGDIYIDAADSTACEAWLDAAKAQAWLIGQLKA